jgi:hypothetical protein
VVSRVRGSWRPLEGTNPYLGEIGEIYEAVEAKVEFTSKKVICVKAFKTIKQVHPYEKPIINVIPLLTIHNL